MFNSIEGNVSLNDIENVVTTYLNKDEANPVAVVYKDIVDKTITAAVILIILSIILTLIGGIIPARAASKKNPVIALRTE